MTDPETHVAELLRLYGSPAASAADLLCDRHPADAPALTVVRPDLGDSTMTFGELREASARLATGFAGLGVRRGDRIAGLLGKSFELVVTMLACWRLGALYVPLFTAFAPAAIAARITGNRTKIVVTDGEQRPKLEPGVDIPADGGWRIVTTGKPAAADVTFASLLAEPARTDPVAVGGDGVLIEIFTSGTTGAPKAVPVPLRAVAAMCAYQTFGLDQRDDDVFWNAADPGWAYGLYYAVVAPLALGRRSLLVRGGFSPSLTCAVLEKFGVTNFAAGPTVYRALRGAGTPMPASLALRCCSAAGEPLTAGVSEWAETALGVPVLDHYGQTELGMVAAAGWHPAVRNQSPAGSMGRALPGWRLDILRAESDVPAAAGELGRLAVDLTGSPLMWFAGYHNAPESTAQRFTADGRWYVTGDTATKDPENHFYFRSRDDDVILMAGYRIGPVEVESVLQQHDAVAEAAVVGVPDRLRGEILVAYVVPMPDRAADDALVAELQEWVKVRLAAHLYPRQVRFRAELPRTPSGKLQRFLLRDTKVDNEGGHGG